MARMFLSVVLLGAALALLGFLGLGLFPPGVHPHEMRHVIDLSHAGAKP